MKNLNYKLFILIQGFITILPAQDNAVRKKLAFKQDSTFKIVQFTDIHWQAEQPGNRSTYSMMEDVLDIEKPDFVVFTGDIVCTYDVAVNDVKKGWSDVVSPVVARGINWTATLGNHDSEGDFKRKSVMKHICRLPYNCNKQTTHNTNDFCLPIATSQHDHAALLYFFDSNEYSDSFKPGKYAWINSDQIDWYLNESKSMIKKNNDKVAPALAFFHIPLPEYKEVIQSKSKLGNAGEGVSSPVINSGLFSALVEQGDVMGIFVGHDHNNDFIGELHGIALAYGRRSGHHSYGDLKIGARVIQLKPNTYEFYTWISTPPQKEFMYSFPEENNTINKSKLLPSIKPTGKLKQGITYQYFEGNIDSTTKIKDLKSLSKGTLTNFSLAPAKTKDHFAFEFNGYIKIPTDGIYTFYVNSDDGCVLYIDDNIIVNNDGGHSAKIKENQIGLKKGFHKFKTLYFEDYMGEVLEIGIKGPTIKKDKISDDMLYTN